MAVAALFFLPIGVLYVVWFLREASTAETP
jgi:hypothetical protein